MQGDVRQATPERGVTIQQAEFLAQAELIQQDPGLLLQVGPVVAGEHTSTLGVGFPDDLGAEMCGVRHRDNGGWILPRVGSRGPL